MDHLIPNLDRNLLSQVEEPKKTLPVGFWTALIADIFTVLLAGAAGFAWRGAMEGGGSFFVPASVSALFLMASSLSAMFAMSFKRRGIVLLLEAAAFLSFWISDGSALLGFALAAILIFSAWGDSALRKEMNERMRIRILPLVRTKLGKSITGFILALVILSFPVWKNSTLPLPERQFRAVYDIAIEMAAVVNPGVKLDSSIQVLAESIVKRQMPSDEVAIGEENKQIKLAAEILIRQAETSLGMDIDPEARSADVFYKYVENSFAGWQKSFGDAFVFFMGIALFIFFRGLGAILNIVAALGTWLIFEFLALSGTVAVIGEPAMQERVRTMK